MRRLLVVVMSACAMVVASATPAVAAPFAGQFKQAIRNPEPPCTEAFICAAGTIANYGAATIYLTPTSDPPTTAGCPPFTGTARVVLADGSGTLDFTVDGTICTPGQSGLAPGGLKSYGNPFRLDLSWTVTGGTGVFADVTGGGSATAQYAGASFRLTLNGDVS